MECKCVNIILLSFSMGCMWMGIPYSGHYLPCHTGGFCGVIYTKSAHVTLIPIRWDSSKLFTFLKSLNDLVIRNSAVFLNFKKKTAGKSSCDIFFGQPIRIWYSSVLSSQNVTEIISMMAWHIDTPYVWLYLHICISPAHTWCIIHKKVGWWRRKRYRFSYDNLHNDVYWYTSLVSNLSK